jgi:transcriptional regulator with XRE-family HTH domain
MKFGERLREERKKQNLSTQNLAQFCGISRSYITLIENGMRLPGRKVLPKISDALGLKTNVVLNWYLEDISYKIHTDLKLK